ncbi:MAG: SDR family oxidoreductase [Halieaceae bacterium]|jgi:NAD(P)-dependent dehydrogenase (short-subunit alcohol dehydrogenase family)|nr:SDR family oxidoreductase [Halieaceae bacterium]MBT6125329.1 SDR family oxidoreductase [Halieaceae bacterium]
MLLEGKTVVILGASAKGGIGWVTAKNCADEGANVVVSARNQAKLSELANQVQGLAVRCDATDPESIAALFAQAHQHFGSVDAALYTPGQAWSKMIADIEPNDLREAANLHYHGAVYFTQQATRRMVNGGAITLMSSISAQHYYPGTAAYAAAKISVEHFARYAAIEYGPRKIRVNTVRPTSTRTPMIEGALQLPGLEAAATREIPLGRIGEPEDVAQTVAWLSSNRAAFITGATIPVDGGNHLLRMPLADELPGPAELEASYTDSSGD